MTYDAGTARATYLLEARQALQTQQALLRGYTQLGQAEQRLATLRGRSGVGALAAEEVKLQQALARTASAQARAAAEANKRLLIDQRAGTAAAQQALAEQRRQTELAKTAQAAARAAQAELRLQQQRERGARQQPGGGGSGGSLTGRDAFQAVAGAAGGPLGGILAAASPAAALGAGAAVLVSATQEAIQLGTQVNKVTRSFDELARQGGTTGDALIQALRTGAAGEIDDLNLKLSANRANLLGVAKSADEFAKLFAIARARSVALGTSTTEAFDDLITGLGRGSPLILDNLGITVKLGEANEAYAKSLGKTVSALTDAEKKQALINAVLATADDLPPPPVDEYAALAATFGTLAQNASASVSQGLAPAAEGINRIGQAILNNREALAELRATFFNARLRADGTFQQATSEDVARERATIAREEVAQATVGGFQRTARQLEDSGATARNPEALAEARQQFTVLKEEAARLSAINNEAADQVQRVSEEYAKTGDLERYAGMLAFIAQQQQDVNAGVPPYIQARAEQQQRDAAASQALDELRAAQEQAIGSSVLARAESEAQAEAQRQLYEAAQQAADGTGNLEGAADRLARQFPITREEALKLLTILRGINDEGAAASALSLKQQENAFRVNPFGPDAAAGLAQAREGQVLLDQQRGLAEATEALRKRREAEERARREAEARARQLGGRGLTADDRADLKLLADDEARLASLRAQYDQIRDKSSLKAKQLLVEIRDLEQEILDTKLRQNQAAVDAQLGAVRDQQARLKEARELAQNQRILAGDGFSDEQKRAAELRNAEILLEQQKRALAIQQDIRQAGPVTVNGTPPPLAQLPAVPQLPTLPPPVTAAALPPLTVNIDIQDGRVASVDAAGVPLRVLINGAEQASTAGAGR